GVGPDGRAVSGRRNLPLRSSRPTALPPGRYVLASDAFDNKRLGTVELSAGATRRMVIDLDTAYSPVRLGVVFHDGSTPRYVVITVRCTLGSTELRKTFRTLRPDRLDVMLPCSDEVSIEVWAGGGNPTT